MNILIYTHHYPVPPDLHIVPDTKVVHYFVRELIRKGHSVRVFYLYYTPVKGILHNRFRDILPTAHDYEYEGVPVHLVKYQMLTPRRSHPQKFQARIINGMIRKWKAGLGWKPDKVYIHFPTTFACLTETLADGVPTLGDCHNMDVEVLKKDEKDPDVIGFMRRIKHLGYRNKRVYEYFTKVCGFSPVPVYSGIDDYLLAEPALIESKKGLRPPVMRIAYVGQLIPLKNVDTLIRAFQQLPFTATLKIIGDGKEMEALRTLAAGDERITFCGWVKRDEAVAALRDADVFVMVSSPETYGLVYLEAMAQGCVTVASRGEGFDGLIVHGENGYLATPGSVSEVKEILCHIHDMSTEEKAKILEGGYRLAESLTESRTTDMFLEANS